MTLVVKTPISCCILPSHKSFTSGVICFFLSGNELLAVHELLTVIRTQLIPRQGRKEHRDRITADGVVVARARLKQLTIHVERKSVSVGVRQGERGIGSIDESRRRFIGDQVGVFQKTTA